jgi:hypothetical protein
LFVVTAVLLLLQLLLLLTSSCLCCWVCNVQVLKVQQAFVKSSEGTPRLLHGIGRGARGSATPPGTPSISLLIVCMCLSAIP